MKYKEFIYSHYYLDTTSPTGLRKSWNHKPAGVKSKHNGGYSWVISDRVKVDGITRRVVWSLQNVLYELAYKHEVKPDERIYRVNDNKDDHSLYNLTLDKLNVPRTYRETLEAWNSFRNVVLPLSNPDYFKAPADWTDPEAVKMLDEEKRKRREGTSKPPKKTGRLRKWK